MKNKASHDLDYLDDDNENSIIPEISDSKLQEQLLSLFSFAQPNERIRYLKKAIELTKKNNRPFVNKKRRLTTLAIENLVHTRYDALKELNNNGDKFSLHVAEMPIDQLKISFILYLAHSSLANALNLLKKDSDYSVMYSLYEYYRYIVECEQADVVRLKKMTAWINKQKKLPPDVISSDFSKNQQQYLQEIEVHNSRLKDKSLMENILAEFIRQKKFNINKCRVAARWIAKHGSERLKNQLAGIDRTHLWINSIVGMLLVGLVLLMPAAIIGLIISSSFFTPVAGFGIATVLFVGSMLSSLIVPMVISILDASFKFYSYRFVNNLSEAFSPFKELLASATKLSVGTDLKKQLTQHLKWPWFGIKHFTFGIIGIGASFHTCFEHGIKQGGLNMIYSSATAVRGITEIATTLIVLPVKITWDTIVSLFFTKEQVTKHKGKELTLKANEALSEIDQYKNDDVADQKLTSKKSFELGDKIHSSVMKYHNLAQNEIHDNWHELRAEFLRNAEEADFNHVNFSGNVENYISSVKVALQNR